jgi:hypothetical protein
VARRLNPPLTAIKAVALAGVARVIVVKGVEIELPTVTSIPLSFAANELITNAAKHGKGQITVRLERNPGGGYALSVSNDRPVLPEAFDPSACKGLGMKIIRSLVRAGAGEDRNAVRAAAQYGLADNLFSPLYRDGFLNRVHLSGLVEGSDYAAFDAEEAGFQVARCGAIYRADAVAVSVLDDTKRPCTRSCLRFGHDARAPDAVRLCRCLGLKNRTSCRRNPEPPMSLEGQNEKNSC